MGEVNNVHYAPHQGEADRDKREQPSLEQAINSCLEKSTHEVVLDQIILASANLVGQTVTTFPCWIWITDMGL